MSIGNRIAGLREERFADLFQVTIDYLVGLTSIPQQSKPMMFAPLSATSSCKTKKF